MKAINKKAKKLGANNSNLFFKMYMIAVKNIIV